MSRDKEENILNFFPALIFKINKPNDFFKKFFLTVILSFLIAFLSIIPLSTIEIGDVAPFPENEYGAGTGATLNLLFYLVIVVGVTFFILFLLRKRKTTILNMIMLGSFSISAGSISAIMIPIWGASLMSLLGLSVSPSFVTYLSLVAFVLFIFLTLFLLLNEFKRSRNIFMILIAAWIGSFMAIIGELTPLFLMAGFATYDVVSVFAGPLGDIIEELRKVEPLESSKAKNGESEDLMLGLGDIVFYSLACSYSVVQLNILGSLIVILTLLGGVAFTLYFLIQSLKNE